MSSARRLLSVLAIGAVLASSARAQGATYVVDDGGGPGVHFTDLPPAIAAAVAGDTLIVRAGSYSAFDMDEGLTLVGEAGAVVGSGSVVHDVLAGERAVVAELGFGAVSILGCAGAVVFDTCGFDGVAPSTPLGRTLVQVDQSADVRFRECWLTPVQLSSSVSAPSAMAVADSRVELSSCTLVGAKGGNWPNPRTGGNGLRCSDGSRVHVALGHVRGGDGGDGSDVAAVNGASGGDAILAFDGSQTIVAGIAATAVIGGDVGDVQGYCCLAPRPGYGFSGFAGSFLRHSGTSILYGDGTSSGSILSAGTVVQAVPADPTLDMDGGPYPGALVTLTLYAVPGQLGQLQQGSVLLVDDDGQCAIEKLTNRVVHRPFGIVPANGVASRTYRVRANASTGQLAVFQGRQVDPATGHLLERTNSVPLVVR